MLTSHEPVARDEVTKIPKPVRMTVPEFGLKSAAPTAIRVPWIMQDRVQLDHGVFVDHTSPTTLQMRPAIKGQKAVQSSNPFWGKIRSVSP